VTIENVDGAVSDTECRPKLIMVANDLLSGRTVYLNNAGTWSTDKDHASVWDAERDALTIDRHLSCLDLLVIDPYAVELDRLQKPLRIRERIRLAGPTAGPVASSKEKCLTKPSGGC